MLESLLKNMESKFESRRAVNETYIIAELSANHNNDLDLAIRTLEAMAKSGADAVKVQTFTADSMTLNVNHPNFMTRPDSAWAGQKLYDLYQKGALPYDWHVPLQKRAIELGMDFFSSPFDLEAVDFLEKLNVPAYKIASLEINHIPLIQYIASKKKPIILSTGVATREDIDLAVETIRSDGNNQITLLKCTTAYPTLAEESNLNHIKWLKDTYGTQVGLSDHSMSPYVPANAVALGASVIEKHFILDRSMGGVDSHFSLEPAEFKQMVDAVRETEKSLGDYEYHLNEKSQSARRSMRSIFISQNVKSGDKVSFENIAVLRPGLGLHPNYYDQLIGKVFSKDFDKGTPLTVEELQWIN